MNPAQGELKITYIIESLEKIAEKIGLHAQDLWPYLVKQVTIKAFVGAVLLAIVSIISAIVVLKYGDMNFKRWKSGEDDYKKPLTIIPLAVIFLCTLVTLLKIIPMFLNPEYFAFSTFLGMLKQ